MKTKVFKLSFIAVVVLVSSVFFSCNKETETTAEPTVENMQKSVEVDDATDNVSSIIESVYVMEEQEEGKTTKETESFIPPCMTKTIVISGMTRTVTLDFGEGCDLPNGNHLSGVITIVYERNPEAMQRTITYSFSNFFFNNKQIEGGGSIERMKSNANGNPQATKSMDITLTWASGASAHRVGTRVREWVEGFGSGTWGDNVFLITGHWTTEFPNGNVNTGIVTVPLRREMACRFIVSGVVAVSHNELSGTLDYGDGDCDNTAIFTDADGVEHTIVLD